MLHHHHEGEDAVLFPLLLNRAPDDADRASVTSHLPLPVRLPSPFLIQRPWDSDHGTRTPINSATGRTYLPGRAGNIWPLFDVAKREPVIAGPAVRRRTGMSTPEGQIVMYGAQWCPDCRRSKAFLDRNGVPYEYVDLETSADDVERVLELNEGRHVIPTIVFPDGSHVAEPSDAELAARLGLPTP